jgi:hypothetical protein
MAMGFGMGSRLFDVLAQSRDAPFLSLIGNVLLPGCKPVVERALSHQFFAGLQLRAFGFSYFQPLVMPKPIFVLPEIGHAPIALIRSAAIAALATAGLVLRAPAATTATLTVNAAQTVRVVDDRVFGLNTAVWDGLLNSQSSINLMTAAGTRALRFPGGGTADTYTWSESDTDNFAAVAQGIHAKVFITVNYGSGTPQQAAAWVTYANVTKGYGFKYWELGNENYGTWEMDNNSPAHDPVEYATRFVQYYNAMKAVDPTIKIGAVAPTTTEGANTGSYIYFSEGVTNPVTNQKDITWTAILLSTLKAKGVTPDFLICHRYEQQAGQESDAGLLQAADSAQSGWQADAAVLRAPLNDYLGAAAANVEICSTENNSVHNNPGKQTTNLVNGLYLADSVGSLLQTEINSLVWWDLRNGPASGGNNSTSLYGWRLFNDYGVVATTPNPLPNNYPSVPNTPFPPYYVAKLLSNFASGGDSVIQATSSSTLLSVYAVKRQNGSVTLLVINKDPANTWTGNVSLSGFTPQPNVVVYSYGEAQDTAAETNPAGTPSVDVQQSSMTVSSGNFSATFSPYSVTVLALFTPPSIATPPVSESVNVGSTAVLTAVGSGAASYQWSFNGTPLNNSPSGTTTDVISGTTGSQLVITNATAVSTGNYTVVAINPGGSSSPSAPAALTVAPSSNPGLATSISTRAFVGTGDNILIGGFYIVGSTSRTVLVQGLGPALTPLGVSGALAHPGLTIHQSQSGHDVTLYSNIGWSTNAGAAEQQVLLDAAASVFASPTLIAGSDDSELLLTLPPGGYSAEVSGADGGTGVALCAIYELP